MTSAGHFLLELLDRYGYAGVGIGVLLESAGLPVPGETALLAAAFAASQGRLSLPLVIATAALAGILGDNLGYWAGHRLGRPWLLRHGKWILLNPERLQRVEAFFERFGPLAITFARFVSGVRVVAALTAGVARMRWGSFLLFNVLGAALWATAVGLAGYYFGQGWEQLLNHLGPRGMILAALLPLAALTLWAFWSSRRRLGTRGPVRAVLALNVVALALFARLSVAVALHQQPLADVPVRRWLLAHSAPALQTIMRALAVLGSAWVVVPLAVVAAAWLARGRGLRPVVPIALATAAAVLAVPVLKLIFAHARTLAAQPGARIFSFPSGHTAAVTVMLLTLAYLLRREKVAGRWVMGAALAAALLVGVGRLFLDVHWATDVVGGWAAGVYFFTIAAVVYERPE